MQTVPLNNGVQEPIPASASMRTLPARPSGPSPTALRLTGTLLVLLVLRLSIEVTAACFGPNAGLRTAVITFRWMTGPSRRPSMSRCSRRSKVSSLPGHGQSASGFRSTCEASSSYTPSGARIPFSTYK